jgi:NAD(P)-dependent dehydrogenase (short-subunit alcohol dehydrogenase family)
MTPRLEGAVAAITGAGRGIGRAIALRFAEQGAAVALAARTGSEVDAVADAVRAAGGRAIAVRCDVRDDEDVVRFAQRTREAFGDATVLVNNAGIHRVAPFLDATLADFQETMEVNYIALVRVTRAFLPAMVAARAGRVINVASTAGKYGSRNQSMYNASKHAVVGLTRCLGLETAANGVRVNAICPGFVDTDMIGEALPRMAQVLGVPQERVLPALMANVPIGRLLAPDEIAHLAVYLASPEADGITGQALTIAGGLILI